MIRLIAALVTLAAVSAGASASIVNFQLAADGDGVITCDAAWSDPVMTITGVQNEFGSGHILADPDLFTTDTAEDPTITMSNVMENDTDFGWTGYDIKIGIRAKNAATALSALSLSAMANMPEDWTATIVHPLALTPSYFDADGRELQNYYIAEIFYGGSTIVAVNDSVDLSYTLSFKGTTSYLFWQEVTPVPEPATMSVLGFGAAMLLRRRAA